MIGIIRVIYNIFNTVTGKQLPLRITVFIEGGVFTGTDMVFGQIDSLQLTMNNCGIAFGNNLYLSAKPTP